MSPQTRIQKVQKGCRKALAFHAFQKDQVSSVRSTAQLYNMLKTQPTDRIYIVVSNAEKVLVQGKVKGYLREFVAVH